MRFPLLLASAAVLAAAPSLASAQIAEYPRKVLIWPGKVGGLLPPGAVPVSSTPLPLPGPQPFTAPLPTPAPQAYAMPPVGPGPQPFAAPPPQAYAGPVSAPFPTPPPEMHRHAMAPSPGAPLPPAHVGPTPMAHAAPAPVGVSPRTIHDAPPPPPPAMQPRPLATATPALDPDMPARRPIWDPHAGRVVPTDNGQPQRAPVAVAAAGAPRAPATAPGRAAPGQSAARMYSVHREFGLAPDPAPEPLPDTFFMEPIADDPAEPPAPEPRYRNRKEEQAARSARLNGGDAPRDRLLGAETD
jgi:hypothetical protein